MLKKILAHSALLGILFAAACGETRSAPDPTTAPTPYHPIERSSSVVPTPTAERDYSAEARALFAAVPTPTLIPREALWEAMGTIGSYPDLRYRGITVASLEERAYKADVVVRARLVSAASDVIRFRSVQYLKGTGPKEFGVRATTEGRDTQWDNLDAMLFLSTLTGQTEHFEFADSTRWDYVDEEFYVREYTGDLPEGYTLGTRNPVWLPVTSSSDLRGSGASGSASGSAIITEYASTGDPVTVSEADVLQTVQWVSGPAVSGGAGGTSASDGARSDVTPTAEEYNKCVKFALSDIRFWRDYQEYHEYTYSPPVGDVEIASGAAAGVLIYEQAAMFAFNEGYNTSEVFGPDAELFVALEVDEDTDPHFYLQLVNTARPLPQGTYTVHHRINDHFYVPCQFDRDWNYVTFEVVATAPERAVHEAFFDPATTASGVGYLAGSATTTGVLDAATFGVGATSATIESIVYSSSTITLRVSPAGALAGHDLEFIAVDGAVALTLDPDTAGASSPLAFAVASAPWAAGDEMMLRVTKDLPPPILDTTFTAGRADTGQNWVTGYSDGFVGSIAGSGFTVGGTATAVEAVLWFDHHPVGEVRLGLTAAVDLSGYTLRFSDSAGTEILVLDGRADEVDSSGKILVWAMQELPWANGETVTLRIRVKE